MSDIFIDRTPESKQKGAGNRERFKKRFNDQLKEQARKIWGDGTIEHIDDGVEVPVKNIEEPEFRHGPGGRRKYAQPGNDRWLPGDKSKRPTGGISGGGGTGRSPNGEYEDDFVFLLNKKEFLEYLFEDHELPYLEKTASPNVNDYKWKRAGITTVGTPASIDIPRSCKQGFGRRFAFHKKEKQEQLEAFRKEFEALLRQIFPSETWKEALIKLLALLKKIWLRQEMKNMERKLEAVPFIDTSDLRFKTHAKEPEPAARAVMFCLMDISGSMDEERKNIAKRFFLLIYLFLERTYGENVEVVFIKHHTAAKEVTEEEFFGSRESGGTIVSTVLIEMAKIMRDRYGGPEWNRFAVQASDGDNWSDDDSKECKKILFYKILPFLQYFAYTQIVDVREQSLWSQYVIVQEHGTVNKRPAKERFAMVKIKNLAEVYPTFSKLFKKKEKA